MFKDPVLCFHKFGLGLGSHHSTMSIHPKTPCWGTESRIVSRILFATKNRLHKLYVLISLASTVRPGARRFPFAEGRCLGKSGSDQMLGPGGLAALRSKE